MLYLYFIRIKAQFVQTFEQKFVNIIGVLHCERVEIEGRPTKTERDFRGPGIDHTMLIVRVRGEKDVSEVQKMLEAGEVLGAMYHYQRWKLEQA